MTGATTEVTEATGAAAGTDETPPEIGFDSLLDNALVRNPQITVTGWVWDDDSGVATVTCNGVGLPVPNRYFSCERTLTPGPNTIAFEVTDVAGNIHTQSLAIRYDDTLTVSPVSPTHVPAATLVTVSGNVMGPEHLPISYLWTQTDGPPVTLTKANTPNVSFVTPANDATLTFQLSVSNSVATASATVEVIVEGFATANGLAAGTNVDHESTLTVDSTTLAPGYIWTGTSAAFGISLSATDGAVIDAGASEGPLALVLHTGGVQFHDVTAWFTYDGMQNELTLNPSAAASFRALMSETLMGLRIEGRDNLSRTVALSVPFWLGRFHISGTLDAPTGTPPTTFTATRLLLEGTGNEYRATVMAAADGSFEFEGAVGGEYTLTAIGPDGLFGMTLVRLDAAANSNQSIAVALEPAPPPSGLLAGGGPAAALMSTYVSGNTGASPWGQLGQQVLTLPQGTKYVQLNAHVSSEGFDEAFWFEYGDRPNHPCGVAASLSALYGYNYASHDNQYGYAVLLNGQLMVSGGGAHCSTALEAFSATTLDTVVDVSHATFEGPAELRLVARSGPWASNDFGVYGTVSVNASAPASFAIMSVRDVNGTGLVKRPQEVVPIGESRTVKLLGIPTGAKTTANTWGMRITYAPSDADILNVQVKAMNLFGPQEELDFPQPTPASGGVITLTNVGFATTPGQRPMWTQKIDNHAAIIWGRRSAYEFLTDHAHIWFNDLSREHGGPFPPHEWHQHGTSIDTRYLGPGGGTNALNGSPGDKTASFRRNRWTAARTGNVDAQREMVAWIRANRTGMDSLASDPRVHMVLFGRALWNLNPIAWGLYEDGTDIIDPDTNQAIGSWAPQVNAVPAGGHLDHIHIELKFRFVEQP